MSEFFLISRDSRILNVVQGDNLTIERAAEVLRLNDGNGERVTAHVTIDQLRRYEQEATP